MSDRCTSCGVCCTHFRVSFYWAETDAHPKGSVPQQLTQKINQHLVCMKGTEKNPVRCVALEGEVGVSVACRIYPLRSTTCRTFTAGSAACNQARAAHGLAAISI